MSEVVNKNCEDVDNVLVGDVDFSDWVWIYLHAQTCNNCHQKVIDYTKAHEDENLAGLQYLKNLTESE